MEREPASDDAAIAETWRVAIQCSPIFEDYIEEGDYHDYIVKRAREMGSERPTFALLHAHGGYEGRTWTFHDNDIVHSLQDWIDRHDGKYTCLLIESCNPGHLSVKSKYSLLATADRVMSGVLVALGEASLSLFDPKIGEIDDYLIEDLLSQE